MTTECSFLIFPQMRRNGILLPKVLLPILRKKNSCGREFAKFLISLEQFIQTVKGQNNFETECFLTYSWRFLRSNTSKQLEFKLELIIGI